MGRMPYRHITISSSRPYAFCDVDVLTLEINRMLGNRWGLSLLFALQAQYDPSKLTGISHF
jgi:hypothetical protein